MKTEELKGYWIVNVPHQEYGYSFGIYADVNENEVVALCIENELFECNADAEYAEVEKMTEYDYEFFKDHIITIK